MIRFILFQNRQGKTRLSRWYVPYTGLQKTKLEGEIHRAVVFRDRRWTHFVEYRNYKLVYRQYAGLFFILCVDINDNELGVYEFIHLIVQALDMYFGSVCELDLVFNFSTVYQILDEMVLGGEIAQTSQQAVAHSLRQSNKLL